MKAMILAAGRGERMMPLTENLPKPLLTVKGKALIEYHLDALAAADIRDVVINVSWLGDKIERALGTGERYGVRIQYSREPSPLETGGAILHAREQLGDEAFLLINADVKTDFPIKMLRDLRLPSDAFASLVLVANPKHNPLGDYFLNDKNKIEVKRLGENNYTFSGLSLIDPKLVYDFPEKKQNFPLRDAFAWALRQDALLGELYEGFWSDVGTPERLAELQQS